MRSNSRALRLRATGLAFASIWLFTLVAAKGLQPIVPWRRVQQILNDPNFQIYLGLGLGVIATVASWYYHQESSDEEKQDRPAFVLRWNFIAILGVTPLALAALLAKWLPAIATDASTRIDAIKTILTFAAGCGAAIALLITMRRQCHQEKATQESNFDATEQRVTDLYSKAVDQLGAPELSTPRGGTYALERLAQGNHRHQQKIVYMLCAHLRVLNSCRDRRLLDPNTDISDYVFNAEEQEIMSAAAISRSCLYAQPDVRAEIERLRDAHRRTPATQVRARQRTSEASLLRRLEAANQRNRKLADDNKRLRELLAQALYEARAPQCRT